jgi:hypothetical protein
MKFRSVFLSLVAVSLASSAFAGTSQGWGGGGAFAPYEAKIAQENASGQQFRIQGKCKSACTMFLGIRNVCVERDAKLYFHAGWDHGVITPAATAKMTSMYNASLRSYVMSNHFMDTREFHKITGDVIISKFGYKACPGA